MQLLLALAAFAAALALLIPVLRSQGEDAVRLGTRTDSSATGATGAASQAATAPPSAPSPPRAWRTVFDDRFTSSQGSWPNRADGVAWFADGIYRIATRQPGRFVAIAAPTRERFRDVIVTAVFRKVGGPAGGGYGIIIRDQGPGPRDGTNQNGRYYVLEAGDRGEYGIWRREDDRWVDIQPWTPSEAVGAGNNLNVLSVQAVGPQLTFSVNGTKVATKTDSTFQEGSVGIFVGGDNNEVAIERFLVQVPE